MDVLDGIILGAVQGLTEFLPVSSSGHLVLAQAILGVETPGIFLEISTHGATLLAILVYFRKRILALGLHFFALFRLSSATAEEKEDLALIAYLLLASIPAGLAGFLLKKHVEAAFENPRLTVAMLCVTGIFLLLTRAAPAPKARWTPLRALAVGVAQAMALLPGISRSGSTVGTGLFLRIEGEKAAEFSFLLAIPAIAGATLLEAVHLTGTPDLLPVACGFLTALVTGYGAIVLLLGALRRRSLWLFGFYCLAVGATGLLLFAVLPGS
jgi:undecaprenyl-diphosphatase